MARAIDGEALWDKLEDALWYDNYDRDMAEKIVLDMPTLTPPNEPLTAAEARAEKAERERDAAISDLTYIARTYPVDLCDDLVCQYCKHYQNVNTGCPGWTEDDCFEWRGKKEE